MLGPPGLPLPVAESFRRVGGRKGLRLAFGDFVPVTVDPRRKPVPIDAFPVSVRRVGYDEPPPATMSAWLRALRSSRASAGVVHDFTWVRQRERLVADLGVAFPENAPERWREQPKEWRKVIADRINEVLAHRATGQGSGPLSSRGSSRTSSGSLPLDSGQPARQRRTHQSYGTQTGAGPGSCECPCASRARSTLIWFSSCGGGERGIRTPGTLARPTVFKTAAFNRSAISP